MSNLDDCDLMGDFIFGDEIFQSCNISENGFIYFGKKNVINTYNPFLDPKWKIIAPFAGNLGLIPGGITTSTENNVFTITFNVYSSKSTKTNKLIFCILLYLNLHETRPNQVDFKYIYSDIQYSEYGEFQYSYYIGYSDGICQKYIQNVDDINYISYGGSNIISKNMYPQNNSEIINITNIKPNLIIPNSINSILYNFSIGGEFIYGSTTYKFCNISSNGYIFFGGFDGLLNIGPSKITTNPFLNLTWKVLAPFAGPLGTTSEGIIVEINNSVCKIRFNCYTKQTSVSNIIVFEIILYLNSHKERPNEVDFRYISSTSQNNNFLGNYFIGCSDGNIQKTILDVDSLVLSCGATTLQTHTTSNVYPKNNTEIKNITNENPYNNIYLPLRFSAIERNVELGGVLKINDKYFSNCTISTNGFIYFESIEKNINQNKKKIKYIEKVREPNEDTSNPFKVKEWIIFSPFCGKLKTTLSGIILSKKISKQQCEITFNCYTTQISNSAVVIFSVIFCYDNHLNTPNRVIFSYKSLSTLFYKQNYYIGYSDGINQKYLSNNYDTELTHLTDLINPNDANVKTTDVFPPIGRELVIIN